MSSSGRPLHIIGEVQEVSRGFRAAADFLNRTRPSSNGMALHFSTNAHEMLGFQPMVKDFNYQGKLMHTVYRPLLQTHLRPDVIHPAADLDDYRVVFSAYLPALDDGGLRKRLLDWIKAGGTWILETVDAAGFVGHYTSIALDAAGNPHVSYRDMTNQNLKYASKSDGTWTVETVDAPG